MQDTSILDTRNHILENFNTHYDTRLVYHNFQRCAEIDKAIAALGAENAFPGDVVETARLAGWFHGLGILQDSKNPVPTGLHSAKQFLLSKQFPAEKINKVLSCIRSQRKEEEKKTPEAQLLSDGINGFERTETFFTHRPLLRLEWELFANRYITDVEWAQHQLQDLLKARFYTAAAKTKFEPILAQNIRSQKQKLEKLKRNKGLLEDEEGRIQKFQNLERKLPERATQTFFRANYRNHINLSIIADNKANIMISVNAIMISVLISLLTYKNITETNPMVLLPVVIFLVTGLTSLIFAVLSIRPKITALNEGQVSVEKAKQNIVFFGNFVNLSLEQYEEAMDAMLRDSQLMYGNMTRDMYYLGKVLDKKYRFLTISYNIFMLGFVAVVLTFLITLLG